MSRSSSSRHIGLVTVVMLASVSCEDNPSTPPVDLTPELVVTAVEPTTIFIGEEFVITGGGFGVDGEVRHVGTELVVVEWTDDTIRAVAHDWREGPLVITTQDSRSVITPPVQSIGVAHSVEPQFVEVGEQITIAGLGFGDAPGEVLHAGAALQIVSWSDGVIRVISGGLRDDEPLTVKTRDFGAVTTPPSTSVVPADLDMTEYRFAWGELTATLMDYTGEDPDYIWVGTDSRWKPELEWDGLSFVGLWSADGHSERSEGSVEESLALAHGVFHSHEWWYFDISQYYSSRSDIEAYGIPLFRVEADTVEYRLVGDAVIDQVSAHSRLSTTGHYSEYEGLVEDPRGRVPQVSLVFTRD